MIQLEQSGVEGITVKAHVSLQGAKQQPSNYQAWSLASTLVVLKLVLILKPHHISNHSQNILSDALMFL